MGATEKVCMSTLSVCVYLSLCLVQTWPQEGGAGEGQEPAVGITYFTHSRGTASPSHWLRITWTLCIIAALHSNHHTCTCTVMYQMYKCNVLVHGYWTLLYEQPSHTCMYVITVFTVSQFLLGSLTAGPEAWWSSCCAVSAQVWYRTDQRNGVRGTKGWVWEEKWLWREGERSEWVRECKGR